MKIIETILEFLKAIPILDRWFSKTPIEKKNKARKKVDEEHDENAESGRPSNDFWKDRGI